MRKLFLLALVVSLAHGLLLALLPARFSATVGRSDGPLAQARAASFVTRTIAPEPSPVRTVEPATAISNTSAVAAPVPALAPVPVRKLAVKPVLPAKAQPTAPELAAAPETAAMEPATAPVSLQLAANSSPVEAGSKTRPEASEATAAAATAPAGGSARPSKVLYPQAARMLYDGHGEEKGFLKYNAGGELLWQPDGAHYNAKLEITFLLARLRTWTSKGELSDAGLQPIRFGDKPRGAEQATHFQRDKGIISFSANNPDVPLQPGAQDKLSAILQLSALVAGAPARYGAGSVISFQAADAHRAELWDFKSSGTESLELPGGTLNGLKLTKEPTVEFDQRIEVWLSPDRGYLPVRLRITESSGAFVDLLWRKTLKPE
ncbi:MAG: DUF3108 domain-containing protein [Rhodoferax sp.]|nr:DUF3108 domain-containing protein [Rhodoferax sp.]